MTGLNTDAEKAIIVGDTSYAIEMAQNIGMNTVAVTYGMHDERHLRQYRSDYLIHDITENQNLENRNPHV